LIGPIGLYIRRNLDETPVFLDETGPHRPLRDIFVLQWDRLLLTIGAVVISNSAQHMLVYIPTYAIRELGMPTTVSFLAAVLAAALQTVFVPFVGVWSDRVGQTRIMIGAAILFVLTAYPVFYFLAAGRTFGLLIFALCWITFLKSLYSGALGSMMAAVFPAATRVTGLSLSYNISVSIFGGFAPFYAASLIELTGNNLAPAFYVMITALASLISVLVLRRRYRIA